MYGIVIDTSKEQNMRNKFTALLAGAIVAAAGATLAFAQGNHENDALKDLAAAQVSISHAITAAEQAAGGKATRAELEHEKQGLVYSVEVASAESRKVMDVHIDAVSGKVLSTKEDKADNGKDEDDD
jgi:uncharacterized membrane protein YkoI